MLLPVFVATPCMLDTTAEVNRVRPVHGHISGAKHNGRVAVVSVCLSVLAGSSTVPLCNISIQNFLVLIVAPVDCRAADCFDFHGRE